ncbi:GNAT family N-acetyltransferase [Nonomuraea sp. NPDC049400]|uniref:GNAT family N-acetyltransferase n=1 Tax=Nonomuraea sp. NPDC049400 TaxID=3364352 RepID=UPI00379AEFD3
MELLDTFVLREGYWPELGGNVRIIRREVFQREQGIPRELDEDGSDDYCIHFLVETKDGIPVGSARMAENHLQRLAVVPEMRKQGIGFLLVASMLRVAHVRKYDLVEATAQTSALGLARLFGFTVDRDPFLIAGRTHHRVSKRMTFDEG